MSYAIRDDLLTEDDKDFLALLSVKLHASDISFARDLTFDELKLVFAVLDRLKMSTPEPEENHVNFALGGCLNEIERLFGKDELDKFISEFCRLVSIRDRALVAAGGLLIYLQHVEHSIKGCCAYLKLRGVPLKPDDLMSNDPERRRATLGQLKNALLATNAFAKDFEQEFEQFVRDRNTFVHSLWVDERRSKGRGLPTLEEQQSTFQFILQLIGRAKKMDRVFRGLWASIGGSLAVSPEHKLFVEDISQNPWLKFIPDYQATLRNA